MALAAPAMVAQNWVIPIVVTLAGTVLSHILGKTTEDFDWFGPRNEPSQTTKMEHTIRMWIGMQKDRPNETVEDIKLQGTTPWVALWDERGELLAEKFSEQFIDQGESRDFVIEGETNRKPGYGNGFPTLSKPGLETNSLDSKPRRNATYAAGYFFTWNVLCLPTRSNPTLFTFLAFPQRKLLT